MYSDIKSKYYDILSVKKRYEFRKIMCKTLGLSDSGFYRRLRLDCFSPLEKQYVEEYINNNPLRHDKKRNNK